MKKFNIALDGPSGAGKSSIADQLAEIYQMKHLDTGAMYRAISWLLNQEKIDPENDLAIENALKSAVLDLPEDGRVIINGIDVSEIIRTPEVSMLASLYASKAPVRQKMVELQQKIASRQGFIVDGRDICDVVLPDALVKIYLDASADARAKRRYLQDLENGKSVEYEEVLRQIEQRDYQDRHRAISPLKISDQAVVIDSSQLNIEQTVAKACKVVNERLKKEGLL